MKTKMTMHCNDCRNVFADVLLEPGYTLSQEAAAHLASCAECSTELRELQATMAVLEDWTAPEPSPYFDARVRAHVRAAETAAAPGLWERLAATLHLGTGLGVRSAVAGAFLFILLLGGGTLATLWDHHAPAPTAQSPAVNDLRIFDNNAQALQQMDLLDESTTQAQAAAPQS